MLNDSKATQKQVDSAKNNLDSAYKGLKKKPAPTVNKAELQALYNQVKSTAKGDFTEDLGIIFRLLYPMLKKY